MSSSGSLKELTRAVNAWLPDAALPLPDDLNLVIDAFLHRHGSHDDSCAANLQDELLSTYKKQVESHHPARTAPFLAVAIRLMPVLRSTDRLMQWWDVGRGVVDAAMHDAALLMESTGWIQDFLLFGEAELDGESARDGTAAVNPFVERLVSAWIEKYNNSQDWNTTGYNEKIVRDGILLFGKKKPKSFFSVLDRFFVKKDSRKASLTLLIELVQSQPPHLHLIQQTPLFTSVLRCLQYDTSTTIVSAALTTIIMLLPNMPSSLVSHLPVLFNIYARLLFWSRDRSDSIVAAADGLADAKMAQAGGWEVLAYSADQDSLQVPRLVNYFTILYGLYPINFMEYIRKPQKYLRNFDSSSSDDVEVEATEMRQKSEPFRQAHMLHPNFYTMTIESERADFGRWIKSEPADVAAECMSLCMHSETVAPEQHSSVAFPGSSTLFPDESEREGLDSALLSGSLTIDSWRNAQSGSPASSRVHSAMLRASSQSSHPSVRDAPEAKARDAGGDSPTLPPHLVMSTSQTQLQDMIQSNKVIKLAINQSLPNDSVPSLSLSNQDYGHEDKGAMLPPPTHVISPPGSETDLGSQMAHLQRQINLLQNDLRFEKYLRQQHVAHIGSLRRRQLSEMATEAETQNLILSNRSLRNRIDEAKKAEMQVRRESEKSRALSKKWEADVYAKFKSAREESKKTRTECERLQRELREARVESEKLRQLVCTAEDRELTWRQQIQTIDMDSTEIERLRSEVDRLTVSERNSQAQELRQRSAAGTAEEAEARAEMLGMELEARDRELHRTKQLLQAQIASLQSRLMNSEDDRRGRKAASSQAIVESALAASRAKQVELQKQCDLLSRKYMALQSSMLDMRSDKALGGIARLDSPALTDQEPAFSPVSGSPTSTRAGPRPHRVFSDPETFEATSYNMTPPLDTKPMAPATGAMAGASAAGGVLGGGVVPSPGGITSPTAEPTSVSPDQRYHGRGGMQNSGIHIPSKIRKEGSGKKSMGIRGIRGFGN